MVSHNRKEQGCRKDQDREDGKSGCEPKMVSNCARDRNTEASGTHGYTHK